MPVHRLLCGARQGAIATTAVVALLLFASSSAHARTETLRWSHPDPSEVSSFRIYLVASNGQLGDRVYEGKPSSDGGVFERNIQVGDNETVIVTVTAVGDSGLESTPSNKQTRSPDSGSSGGGSDDGSSSGSGGDTTGGDSTSGGGSDDGSSSGSGGDTTGGDSTSGGGGPMPGVSTTFAALEGKEKFKVPTAGKERSKVTLDISYGDGVWMGIDDEGRVLTGTYVRKGRRNRKIVFTVDAETEIAFFDRLALWADEMREERGIEPIEAGKRNELQEPELKKVPVLKMKLNKKKTRGKLTAAVKLLEPDRREIWVAEYELEAEGDVTK